MVSSLMTLNSWGCSSAVTSLAPDAASTRVSPWKYETSEMRTPRAIAPTVAVTPPDTVPVRP